MKLDQVPLALSRLENSVAAAVAQAIQEFKSETGTSPDSIDITLRPIQTFGGRDTQVLVSVEATCVLKAGTYVGGGQ